MKINILANQPLQHPEVDIRCNKKDSEVDAIVDALELHSKKICAKNNSETIYISPNQVLYFETVDKKTFAYLSSEVVETDHRLYELTNSGLCKGYVRISKTMVLNVFHVNKVLKLLGGNLDITLSNNEHILVSRRFVRDFKSFIAVK